MIEPRQININTQVSRSILVLNIATSIITLRINDKPVQIMAATLSDIESKDFLKQNIPINKKNTPQLLLRQSVNPVDRFKPMFQTTSVKAEKISNAKSN